MNRNRDWLLDEFMLDGRFIVSGLTQVTSVLESAAETAENNPLNAHIAI